MEYPKVEIPQNISRNLIRIILRQQNKNFKYNEWLLVIHPLHFYASSLLFF